MRYIMVVLGSSKEEKDYSSITTSVDIEASSERSALIEAAKVMAHIKYYNPDINYEYFLKRSADNALIRT